MTCNREIGPSTSQPEEDILEGAAHKGRQGGVGTGWARVRQGKKGIDNKIRDRS